MRPFLWFLIAIFLQEASGRDLYEPKWKRIEAKSEVEEASADFRAAISKGVEEMLDRQFDMSMNATKGLEGLLRALNNNSLNNVHLIKYFPSLAISHAQHYLLHGLKKFRNNGIREGFSARSLGNTLADVINASNTKAFPSKFADQPTVVFDNMAAVGRVLSDSFMDKLYWAFESIPRGKFQKKVQKNKEEWKEPVKEERREERKERLKEERNERVKERVKEEKNVRIYKGPTKKPVPVKEEEENEDHYAFG